MGSAAIEPSRLDTRNPSQDELVAYLLTGLCGAQITPVHIKQVREQMRWVYPENQ